MRNSAKVAIVLLAVVKVAALGTSPYPEQSLHAVASLFEAKLGGRETPDGQALQCPLPESLHIRNTGGSDGAGLCVFTSLEHSARWQNIESLQGYQAFMQRRPGGGYPAKVDQTIDALCKEKKAEKPHYIQIESADIEILKLACRTHRTPGVTYGYSPSGRYGGQRIAHMVSLIHADDHWFCVLDNNFPRTYEWMTPNEFKSTYTSGGRTGWSVIFLAPSPPPPLAERRMGDEP